MKTVLLYFTCFLRSLIHFQVRSTNCKPKVYIPLTFMYIRLAERQNPTCGWRTWSTSYKERVEWGVVPHFLKVLLSSYKCSFTIWQWTYQPSFLVLPHLRVRMNGVHGIMCILSLFILMMFYCLRHIFILLSIEILHKFWNLDRRTAIKNKWYNKVNELDNIYRKLNFKRQLNFIYYQCNRLLV